jgi:hypothetical protein
MVAFGHTAVGVIVGVGAYQVFGHGDLTTGLIATGALGVISHYIMDCVPHGHFFRGSEKFDKLIIWVILFDLLMPILLLLGSAHYLGKNIPEILYVLFGIGGSQLPDVLDGLMRIKILPRVSFLKLESSFHEATHWHGKDETTLLFTIYDIWQIAVFVLAFYILVKF